MFTNDALALNSGECTFTNQRLTYSGVNLPSSITNNNVVLQTGTRGARDSFISGNRFRSNVDGIVLESKFTVHSVASYSNEIMFKQFKKPTYSNNQNISGTFNQPLFDVIKSGTISDATSVTLNLDKPFKLASFIWNTSTNDSYFSSTNVPDSASIPVYNASCSITHPTNVDVSALIPGVRTEVSSYFNIVLNCADKAVMQNNIQLTVNPVITTGVTASSDKSSLLYNSGGQVILMNIYNSVGTETQMDFSTSNSSQASSFTIPMRANFMLGSTGYGSFSFQTQLSVRYN